MAEAARSARKRKAVDYNEEKVIEPEEASSARPDKKPRQGVSFTPAILPGSTVIRPLLRIPAWPFTPALSLPPTLRSVHCGRFACMATEVEIVHKELAACLNRQLTDSLSQTASRSRRERTTAPSSLPTTPSSGQTCRSCRLNNPLLLLRCKKKKKKKKKKQTNFLTFGHILRCVPGPRRCCRQGALAEPTFAQSTPA